MKIRETVYIVLNVVAFIFYLIAFFTKSLLFLGIGGCTLILNSVSSLTFDFIQKKKRSRKLNIS